MSVVEKSPSPQSPPKKLPKIDKVSKETNRAMIQLKKTSILEVNSVLQKITESIGLQDEKIINTIKTNISDHFVAINDVRQILGYMVEDKYDIQNEKDEEVKKLGRAELQMEHRMKLSSMVFSRWVLETFKNSVLGKVNSNVLQRNVTTAMINAAWEKFFTEPSEDQDVVQAQEKMAELLPDNVEIKIEISRILSSPGTQSNMTPEKWISKRSTKLYYKYSDCIHNLKKINWLIDQDLSVLLPFLPNVKPYDVALISILHEIVKPFITKSTDASDI